MKAKRIATKILVALALIVVTVLILRAILNYAAGKKLEGYLRAAKAAGTPLTMKEMVPSCPDPDNAALPWKAAEVLFLLDKPDRDLLDRTVDALFYGRAPDDAVRTRLAALVQQNRRPLDLTIEAGNRACFRYGDWSQPGVSVRRPNSVALILMTRLLALEAVLRADEGQVSQALEELRSGLNLTRRLLDESVLISGLVALADMKILTIAFNYIAQRNDLPPETMAAWIGELEPGVWRSRFLRCLSGERAYLLEFALDILKGKPSALEHIRHGAFFPRLWMWMIRPALKSELVWIQEYFEGLQKAGNQPYYQVTRQSSLKADELPWYFVFTGAIVPNMESSFLKEATLEAMMLTTQAGLACRVYRKQTGRYPARLGDLVPSLFKEEPLDPFTGKPLVYRLENGEVLIYSVGSNRKDDGGRETYKFDKMIMDKDDDWTWRERIK
jgi:hypothetical protein